MDFMKLLGRGKSALAVLFAGILLAGCGTDGNYKFDPLTSGDAPAPLTPAQVQAQEKEKADVALIAHLPGMTPPPGTSIPGVPDAPVDATQTLLQSGDSLIVSFTDIPNTMAPSEDTIKEDGTITLPYDQKFVAIGKTVGALQAEIRARYVPLYWKYLTVTIKISDRFYFVGGEVRSPGRQVYTGKMTVLKAIDTTGGYTDYAAKWRVQLTRANGGKTLIENCNKAVDKPSLDLEVFPGDRIFVPKRIF
jgi:protein involved in polysaccharide export with SLBB domain